VKRKTKSACLSEERASLAEIFWLELSLREQATSAEEAEKIGLLSRFTPPAFHPKALKTSAFAMLKQTYFPTFSDS